MSELELNAVRRRFDHFAAGREDLANEDLPADFVFRDHVIPEAPGVTDRDGMRQNLSSIQQTFDEISWTALEYRDLGSKVAIRVRFEGHGKESGARVTREIGQLWTFRDGVEVRFEIFESLEEALRAAAEE